jgi:predicted Rossmann fold nucleotide-binding protein DprA/Smf involved in DNA uptake
MSISPNITEVTSRDLPPALRASLNRAKVARLWMMGNGELLGRPLLAVICSAKCPGSVVIKTFDAIRELRDAGITVAGGFHSPMEQDCLDFLLRGEQPVIICLAKGLGRTRVPALWRAALDVGRLLVVSPFAENVRRTTKAQAQTRNEFVAALAAVVLVPHASPGGKAEAVARAVLQRGQPLFTFEDDANSGLLERGARRYNIDDILECIEIPLERHA